MLQIVEQIDRKFYGKILICCFWSLIDIAAYKK